MDSFLNYSLILLGVNIPIVYIIAILFIVAFIVGYIVSSNIKNSTIKEKNAQIESINKKLESLSDSYKKNVTGKNTQIESINKKLENLDDVCDSYKKTVKEKDTQIESINKKLENLGDICSFYKKTVDDLKSRLLYTDINTIRDVVNKYYALIRKENSETSYKVVADIRLSIAQTYNVQNISAITSDITTFTLECIYWSSGGHTSFLYENPSDGVINLQSVTFDKEIRAVSSKGEVYYVTLTSELVDANTVRLASISQQTKKLSDFKKSVISDINRMLDLSDTKYFATLFADYHKYLNLIWVHEFTTKPRPALKSAETLKQVSTRLHNIEKEYNLLKYQMEIYENVFPWITEFEQISRKDIESIRGACEDVSSEASFLKEYISLDEYNKLSKVDKYQLALDRYKKKPKNNWQIGISFERYIGYLFEVEGYNVIYNGAKKQLEDLGRDLIAYKDGYTTVIQCKYWKKEKQIHEKHIFQLFGTMFALSVEGSKHFQPSFSDDCIDLKSIKGIFVTTAKLSDTARLYAKLLNIEIRENVSFDKDYPCIKCNIGKNREKIFHLPFDQQYDNVVIDYRKGEQYVSTVQEAVDLGFRRAFKWVSLN